MLFANFQMLESNTPPDPAVLPQLKRVRIIISILQFKTTG